MKPLQISLLVSVVLLLAKLAISIYTNSYSVLAEAIHSLSDIASALLALLAVRLNKEHLSHKIEAIILLLGSAWVSVELFSHTTQTSNPLLGAFVCFLSLLLYSLTYRHNYTHNHSKAVRANLTHLMSDIGASAATGVSLLAMAATGWLWLDKLVAAIIVVWLLSLAMKLLKEH